MWSLLGVNWAKKKVLKALIENEFCKKKQKNPQEKPVQSTSFWRIRTIANLRFLDIIKIGFDSFWLKSEVKE